MLLIAQVWHYTHLCATLPSHSRQVMLTNQDWPKCTGGTRVDYYIQFSKSPLFANMLLRVGEHCMFFVFFRPDYHFAFASTT